ncbi:HTH-type transcriptional regulator HdfR [Castellaniella defragrans]
MKNPVLDLDLLVAFVAVADHRLFTRAAAALDRTQSAVSMQIQRLEDQLQVKLFHRTKLHVELSTAGESFLGYARRLLTLNDEAIGRVRDHRVEGLVRLGVMEDYGTLLVPALLARFMAGHPRIRVEMETGLTSSMPERLGNGFDLVIAMHPGGQGGGRFLRREQAVWAGSPDHAVGASDPLPLALYPQGCLFRKWALEALDAMKRPWRLAFVSRHTLTSPTPIPDCLPIRPARGAESPSSCPRKPGDHEIETIAQPLRMNSLPGFHSLGCVVPGPSSARARAGLSYDTSRTRPSTPSSRTLPIALSLSFSSRLAYPRKLSPAVLSTTCSLCG